MALIQDGVMIQDGWITDEVRMTDAVKMRSLEDEEDEADRGMRVNNLNIYLFVYK